jgi:hypothetical protein
MIPDKGISLPPLRGGMNGRKDYFSVKLDEACLIRNQHLDSNGISSTRRGLRKLNSTPLAGPIESIYQFQKPDGATMTRTVLVTAGEKWYKWDSTLEVFSEIGGLTSSARPTLATFQDGSANTFVVLANGTDLYKYDGTTVSNLTASFPSTSSPRYITVYDNRLFATGCDNDPFALFVSNLLDGTTWTSGDYFMFSNDVDRERIQGLGKFYNFLAVLKNNSVHIITEGAPDSSTVQQIAVHHGGGTTSHWSIVSQGNNLFFCDATGIYRGRLRDAVENGMVVEKISDNVEEEFSKAFEYDRLSGVYDPNYDEILFGMRSNLDDDYKNALIFNSGLSVFDSSLSPNRAVWSGLWSGEGFRSYTFGTVILEGGGQQIWVGDEDGYVYVMGESTQFSDDSSPIVVEIESGILSPGGFTTRKRFNTFCTLLFQNHNESVTVDYVVDSRFRTPSTPVTVENYGNIPYWNEGSDEERTQEWDTTIWVDRPLQAIPLSIREEGNHMQVCIKCAGTNSKDDISYGGGEIYYQLLGLRRN